eukprot:1732826-Rhodomonas_salina.1
MPDRRVAVVRVRSQRRCCLVDLMPRLRALVVVHLALLAAHERQRPLEQRAHALDCFYQGLRLVLVV